MSTLDRLFLQQREMQIKREAPYIIRDIPSWKSSGQLITVITGPRRAGKSTTALCQLILGNSAAYINFDDEDLATAEDFLVLEAALNNVYGAYDTLVIDEIQNLKKWELVINRLQRQGVHLIITGSNAHLLSGELATHLTGRYIPIFLLPFSFQEFIRVKTSTQLTTHEYIQNLREYAETGGYPEVVIGKMESSLYLNTLLQAILFKDIVRRFQIRYPQSIEDIAFYLISNPAVEYSYANLSLMTDVSINTVKKYLHYLHETFLFFSIPRFSWKVREQVSSNKKIYLTDTGLFSARSLRHSRHTGRLYENIVAIHLYRESLYGESRVYFWKGKQGEEVDFVIQKGHTIKRLIQVSLDLSDPKTLQREIRGLLKASTELNCDDLMIISEDEERTVEPEWYGLKGKIQIVPLYKFLLNI